MSGTSADTTRWEPLQRWSPTLFLVGGLLVLGSLVNNSLIRFAGMSLPETLGIGLTLAGFVAALVGVTGFYPELSDQTPLLARASLAVVVGAGVGLVTLLVWAVAMVSFSAPEPSPVIALPTLLLMLAAYCLFGVAILRTTAYPRSVGLMLLALVGVFIVVFLRSIIVGGEPSDLFTVVSEMAESALLLGIGALLRARPARARHEEPSPT